MSSETYLEALERHARNIGATLVNKSDGSRDALIVRFEMSGRPSYTVIFTGLEMLQNTGIQMENLIASRLGDWGEL